jgi:ZIP family zinc transporter
MAPLIFAAVTFLSTALGGLFALRQRRHLYLVMGAAAGLLVGAALLDLLPDALRLVHDQGRRGVMAVLCSAAVGFLVFFGIDRLLHLGAAGHQQAPHDEGLHEGGMHVFGAAAALGLTVHSFLDGLAIGAAFRADASLGAVIGIAVVAHDFGDGVSTVGVVIASKGALRASMGWLVADAVAPVLGALAARTVNVPQPVLAYLLGFFAGSFLFVGAAHLLPEALGEGRRGGVALAVGAGAGFVATVTWLAER